ncbi:hypothetical protein [Roseateles amylovorans]|uniref:Uncharacterized protein n=1 Tax=Roseateles amylovorans TaxID=2978473 RepID=A0ABY6AZS8_9BURK|nr:hypothetical protein [Roseateles amylovorans]UXH78090.1 hypothetical protein N4261_24575 [Roseateles amylovorans]
MLPITIRYAGRVESEASISRRFEASMALAQSLTQAHPEHLIAARLDDDSRVAVTLVDREFVHRDDPHPARSTGPS